MKKALREAYRAYSKNEVPVGAVIVKDNKVIASAHNQKMSLKDPTKHAEIIAIQRAAKSLGHWWLEDCDMYVTFEPCAMCSGAILNARMRNVYIGLRDNRMGTLGTAIDLSDLPGFNHKLNVEFGVLEEDSKKLMSHFFKKLRNKKSTSFK